MEGGWITELGLTERGEMRWHWARSSLRDFILQEELLSRLFFLCSSKISSSTEKQEGHAWKVLEHQRMNWRAVISPKSWLWALLSPAWLRFSSTACFTESSSPNILHREWSKTASEKNHRAFQILHYIIFYYLNASRDLAPRSGENR